MPAAIVPKGKFSDAYIAEAMLRKYLHGIPFGKMVQDFQAMGSDPGDAELADLAQRFACFLSPVCAAIRAQVLGHVLVHIDETPLPTQDGGRYLWAWLGGTQAFFHSGGRGGKELRQVLGLPDPAAKPDPGSTPLVRTLTRFAFAMADGYPQRGDHSQPCPLPVHAHSLGVEVQVIQVDALQLGQPQSAAVGQFAKVTSVMSCRITVLNEEHPGSKPTTAKVGHNQPRMSNAVIDQALRALGTRGDALSPVVEIRA